MNDRDAPKKKVYVVTASRNYESHIETIFDDENNAKEYVTHLESKESMLRWYPATAFTIEEFYLNER